MSSKLPGFIKWWLRCLNQNVAKASRSQSTCEDISEACLHLSHSGLFTSPSLNKCPFKQQYPLSNLVTILSWFLLRLSISTALYAEGFLRKLLACLYPRMDCKCFSCFLLVQSLIIYLATFAYIPSASSGPMSGCEEPSVASLSDFLFHLLSRVSRHPCQLNPVMFCHFHHGLMTIPD